MDILQYNDAREMWNEHGYINICEPDIRSLFRYSGDTYKGVGYSTNPSKSIRTIEAFEEAIKHFKNELKRAKSIMINVSFDTSYEGSYKEFDRFNEYFYDTYCREHDYEVMVQWTNIKDIEKKQDEKTARVFVGLCGIK